MKVAVVGSRDINDYDWISNILKDYPITEVVSGGAAGVDSLGARYATEHNLKLTVFYPDWKLYGKSAGFIRNKLIVDHADQVLAFWNGKSTGTKHSIDYAHKTKKPYSIFFPNK